MFPKNGEAPINRAHSNSDTRESDLLQAFIELELGDTGPETNIKINCYQLCTMPKAKNGVVPVYTIIFMHNKRLQNNFKVT